MAADNAILLLTRPKAVHIMLDVLEVPYPGLMKGNSKQ